MPERVGVDFEGTVINHVAGPHEDCCNSCKMKDGCVGYTFDDQCFLYSSITGTTPSSGVISAQLKSKYVVRELCSAENNVDYSSKDLVRFLAPTPDPCCEECAVNPDCNAYTWTQYNGGSCWLKTARGQVIPHDAPTDGNPYFVSGWVYKCQPLQQNTDISGADLSNANATQPTQCCGICRTTTDCTGFSWTNYNGGTCWLKKGSLNFINAAGVQAASVN